MRIILTSFFIITLLIPGSVWAAIRPNDPYYLNQWYLSKIEADQAWTKISSSPNIIIAVIDSGVQIDHPDLKKNIWVNRGELAGDGIDNDGNGFIDDVHGWDFTTNRPNPNPSLDQEWTEAGLSHGTIVAGIIAASGNNNEGITGLTWRTQIMPLKALDDKGEGKISDVIRAIDYAINNGAHIINLSFTSSNYSAGLEEAINRAYRAGLIVVAAAGNEQASGLGYDTKETKLYPACYGSSKPGENIVLGVAATDALDQKAVFSSYGSNCVDISAPGISFFSTVTYSPFLSEAKYYDGYFSGTSLAAPLVSATLALIAEANPELSRQEIIDTLLDSADNIEALNPDYQGQLGAGRLNVNRAVELAKKKLYSQATSLMIMPYQQDEPKSSKLVTVNGQMIGELDLANLGSDVSFASADIDGDGEAEIVLGSAPGERPLIKIYDLAGKLKHQFLAYEESFLGGVNLTLADLTGDGRPNIIVAPASAGPAEIKIYTNRGDLIAQHPVAGSDWRGGLSLASGNLDSRGLAEIVVGFASDSEPQVRIINAQGKLTSVFLAYEKEFRGGVNVSVANLNGRVNRSQAEIVVTPGPGRLPEVKIFDHHAILQNKFLAFADKWQNGVSVQTGDVNHDGLADIIVSVYPGGAPHVRAFNRSGLLLESFYAYEENFLNGVKAGIIKLYR